MVELFDIQGTRGTLAVHRWSAGAPRYTVLLAHGYGEHAGRYQHVASRLVDDGAEVVAPDHLGHGRSDGERALIVDIDDLVTALQLVAARVVAPGQPLVLLGHSMGGVIATRYAQRFPAGLSALVLSGPVIGGNPGLEALAEMDPIPDVPIDPAMLSRDPSVGAAYAADELVYHGPFRRDTLRAIGASVAAIAAGPGLGALPTLWVHGELDQLAPLEVTRGAVQRLRASDLTEHVYPGAQHEVFNEINGEQVIDDVVAFLHTVV